MGFFGIQWIRRGSRSLFLIQTTIPRRILPMDCQYLHHMQCFLGVNHPCTLLQSLRPNLVVYPTHRADLSLYAPAFLGESGKNVGCRYLNVLRIRIRHQHATDIIEIIRKYRNDRNDRKEGWNGMNRNNNINTKNRNT